MHTSVEIQKLCEQIARDFHPERIILFGSYAYGQPTPDSDIDLLVVMPFKGRPTQQAIRILNKLNVLAPIDLLVRTSEQVQLGKTHNLLALLGLVLPVEPQWNVLQPFLTALNVYAVAYRYPGNSATKTDARGALKDCRAVRRVVRQSFGLPV